MKACAPPPRHRALRDILVCGLCGGVLIVVLKLTEYRFLVVERSVETNAALTFIQPFPIGLVASLISAAILRKRSR